MGSIYNDYIGTAFDLIEKYHQGQVDKGGNDYADHLYTVSDLCVDTYGEYSDEHVVALLHDILEDTDCTVDVLKREGISQEIIDSIVDVTRKDGETYADFIIRVSKSETAKHVKMCDLEDNMDITRLKDIDKSDFKRLRKYLHSWHFLAGNETEEQYREFVK